MCLEVVVDQCISQEPIQEPMRFKVNDVSPNVNVAHDFFINRPLYKNTKFGLLQYFSS